VAAGQGCVQPRRLRGNKLTGGFEQDVQDGNFASVIHRSFKLKKRYSIFVFNFYMFF